MQAQTDLYHPTLMAALHARAYGECLERLARYKQLGNAEELHFTTPGDETIIEVS